MDCPNCGNPTKVVDSRPNKDSVTRWRKCTACRFRFKTIEIEVRPFNKITGGKNK